MNTVLGDANWKYAVPYLDDIIIFSKNALEHKQHLESIMGKLKAAGITLNGAKCKFFRKEIEYLGYIMSKGQVRPDPEKIRAIQECGLPETLKQLRSFLGLANIGG